MRWQQGSPNRTPDPLGTGKRFFFKRRGLIAALAIVAALSIPTAGVIGYATERLDGTIDRLDHRTTGLALLDGGRTLERRLRILRADIDVNRSLRSDRMAADDALTALVRATARATYGSIVDARATTIVFDWRQVGDDPRRSSQALDDTLSAVTEYDDAVVQQAALVGDADDTAAEAVTPLIDYLPTIDDRVDEQRRIVVAAISAKKRPDSTRAVTNLLYGQQKRALDGLIVSAQRIRIQSGDYRLLDAVRDLMAASSGFEAALDYALAQRRNTLGDRSRIDLRARDVGNRIDEFARVASDIARSRYAAQEASERQAFTLRRTQALAAWFAALLLTVLAAFIIDRRERWARQRLYGNVVERLALSQAQLEAIFENSPYGALLADRSGEIVRSNVRLKALIDANELETFVIRDPRYAQLFDGDRTGFSVEVRSESAGVFRWVACDVSSIALPGNRTTVALAFARDITARREAEMKLRYETNHDSVSRLPNRAYFIERVGREIAEEPGASRAVAFLDLRVEESGAELGYTGDELFAAVSARLASSVEPNDFVARFDGSTFVVLLYGRCDRDSVRPVIEKFMQRLKEPIVMDAREVHVRAWAGVALTDRPYAEVLDILRDAEIAMFEARSGDLDFAVFTPDMRDRAARRLALVSHLRKALERDQLYLVYQPLIDSVSRRVHGFEALLRWEHPELGNIPPMEFIPLAEDVGTIAAIGRFVLERACAQLAIWQTAGLVRPGACSIAVNVSVHELVAADYPAFVTRTLARHAIEPASIVLEITEGAFISGDGDAPAALERLKAIGVSLAIDDFGTGYSSLRYLHDFSFDELKIDASFVRGADGELAARPIVMMLTTLAKSLGVSLVAEGVETRAQADALLELGVDTLQGYYFGRPISAALVPEYLRNHEARVLAERGVKEMGNVTPLKPALPKSSA